MPSGSLVAGFQKRPLPDDKVSKEIAFWEKNGLRHGEFVLPDQAQNIVLLEFNADSNLLALLCMDNARTEMSVLICVRSNWKWQVKQKVGPFNFAETKGIRALRWMTGRKQ